jgi:polar amino acid transport system substrate-binding protein
MAVAAPSFAQAEHELVWGGDAEGGAPFVSADPNDTSKVVGFEVDIADLLARGLGGTAKFLQVGFTSLDAAVVRGDFDIGLSGIEDLPSRKARLALTIPYYEFEEKLTVRAHDRDRFRSLADLKGRRVATLAATLAAEVLQQAERENGVIPVLYEDDVHPYSDLVLGRVDAVVLDQVLAERGVRWNPTLINQESALAIGHYVGILSPARADLRDRIDVILRSAMRDGTLERIFRRYDMWNDRVAALYAKEAAATTRRLRSVQPAAPARPAPSSWGRCETIFPQPSSRRRHHDRPLLSVDGTRCRRRDADRQRTRVWRPDHAGRVDDVCGGDARDPAPAAALRALLRPRHRRPASSVGGRAPRPRVELRCV